MATKKPLPDMVPEILRHIHNHQETLDFNFRLYKVYEGQVRAEVERSLEAEMVSKSAFNRAKQRIPAINVAKKAVDKLSKVYAQAPLRTSDYRDKEVLGSIEKIAEVNRVMGIANTIYNLHRCVAIEPFVQDGKQSLRVLAAHQFLPFSDDETNPLNMTVFIKYMGTILENRRVDNKDGVRGFDKNDPIEIDIFHLFSDSEFLIIDSTGQIRPDKMAEHPWSDGVNRIGVIPQVYLNKSKFELVPYPNKSALDISILIPKLLTDLNYAAQFLSHSIIWSANADLSGAEIHPDTILNLGDTTIDGGQPQLGTIEPKVDIESVLQLIEFELSGYFSSIGIKTSTVGSMMPGREASGFAKAMDEGDTTAERKVQVEEFKSFERLLWNKLQQVQNYWSERNMVVEKRKFSPTFSKSFAVQFGEMKHLVSEKERIENIKALRDLKLISKKRALKEIKPELSDDQLDEWIAEIESDPIEQEPKPTPFGASPPQFNGQSEVGAEEDSVGPNQGTDG